jgi:hypothetical protein
VDCVLAIHDVESGVHNKQVFDNVAAEVPEYVALPQFVHAVEPIAVLYWPVLHASQAEPSAPPLTPVYPALHLHAATAVLPAGDEAKVGVRQALHVDSAIAPPAAEYLPIPQSVHIAGPVPVLYLPAAHWRHVPPLGPDDPVLHVQLVEAALPAGDDASEDVVQAVHVDSADIPTAAEYLPTPQSVHAADPEPVLYFPATQVEQATAPPVPVYPRLQMQSVCAVLVVVGVVLPARHAVQPPDPDVIL